MGVEAGRDDDEIRRKGIERGQNRVRQRGAECLAARIGHERNIQHVVRDATFARTAGAGIKRHLMCRCVKKIRLVPENLFGAIAVMHIEVDHSDALEKSNFTGMKRTHRDIVDVAESHRAIGRRVMTGRTHGTKRIRDFSIRHVVDSARNGAGRAQGRLRGAARHEGVGVDRGVIVNLRLGVERPQNGIDMVCGMDSEECLAAGSGGRISRKCSKIGAFQRGQHGPEPLRTLRMARRRDMAKTSRMREQTSGHAENHFRFSDCFGSSSKHFTRACKRHLQRTSRSPANICFD